MYIKEKFVKLLKIKNTVLPIICIIDIAASLWIFLSLVKQYDWETVKTAKSMPGIIRSFTLSPLLLLEAYISKALIRDAHFYSNCFELDLDGKLNITGLSDISGKRSTSVLLRLLLLRLIYMKDFTIKRIEGKMHVVLRDKTYACECQNCGAVIEKSIYFTGICPYCRGSDLNARVIAGSRFYSISNESKEIRTRPSSYHIELDLRRGLTAGSLALAIIVLLVLTYGLFTTIGHYNDQDYIKQAILTQKYAHRSSVQLVKREMMDDMISMGVASIAMLIWIFYAFRRLICIIYTEKSAGLFAASETPFIPIKDFNLCKGKKSRVRKVKSAICRGYLKRCTFEMHSGEMNIALARKIVKDKCPNCAAEIVGAVDVNYQCKYCKSMIMDVIKKK